MGAWDISSCACGNTSLFQLKVGTFPSLCVAIKPGIFNKKHRHFHQCLWCLKLVLVLGLVLGPRVWIDPWRLLVHGIKGFDEKNEHDAAVRFSRCLCLWWRRRLMSYSAERTQIQILSVQIPDWTGSITCTEQHVHYLGQVSIHLMMSQWVQRCRWPF